MRILFLALLLALIGLLAWSANAQTISPLMGECGGKKCTGQFTVTNNGIVPLAVSIDAHAVTFTAAGEPILHPLDSTTHVKLSETSARVAPRQGHDFSYTIQCDALPCVIGFAAGMSAGHTDNGMAVRLVLETAVYICEKSKGCRASIRKSYGL
jgi:hypothetical protein